MKKELDVLSYLTHFCLALLLIVLINIGYMIYTSNDQPKTCSSDISELINITTKYNEKILKMLRKGTTIGDCSEIAYLIKLESQKNNNKNILEQLNK